MSIHNQHSPSPLLFLDAQKSHLQAFRQIDCQNIFRVMLSRAQIIRRLVIAGWSGGWREMKTKLHSKLFSSLKLESFSFRERRTHEMKISRNVIKYLFSFRLDPSFFYIHSEILNFRPILSDYAVKRKTF